MHVVLLNFAHPRSRVHMCVHVYKIHVHKV